MSRFSRFCFTLAVIAVETICWAVAATLDAIFPKESP